MSVFGKSCASLFLWLNAEHRKRWWHRIFTRLIIHLKYQQKLIVCMAVLSFANTLYECMDRFHWYYCNQFASKEALFLRFRMPGLKFYLIDGQICYWGIISSSLVVRCHICADWSIVHHFFHRIYRLRLSCILFQTLPAFLIITRKFNQSYTNK
jgi:hypothetical protein